MSILIRGSTPTATSHDYGVQIYDEEEKKSSATQESELKGNFSEIPLTSIRIHPALRLVRVIPKQSQPPKTPLGRLPSPLYLIIAAFSKYKDSFNLSLTCRYFWKNLSVEGMVEGTTHSPEQAWKNFVMNEYPLDYCRQKENIKSFQDFYKERSLVHRRIRASSFVTFPRLDLPIKVEKNKHNSIDANCYGIVTLSQVNAFSPLISLWNMQTGLLIASTNVVVGGPFVLINVIKCNDTEIAYGCSGGFVRFLRIENRTFDGGDRDEKLIGLVRRGSVNVNQSVRSMALGKNWHAYGTLIDRIIMHQRSSEKTIILRGHEGCVDYLEFIDDACVASASCNSSRINVWKTPCLEGNVDWNEEDASSPITLNMSSLNDQPGIRCLHWSSPDRLYSGDLQGTIRVWNPFKEAGQMLLQFKMHQSPISSIQTMQDLIVSTGENGRFVVVNEKAQLVRSSAASTALVKIMENKMITINLGGDVRISMPSEKPVKLLHRISTTAKVACIALVVTAITIFFIIQDQDKN